MEELNTEHVNDRQVGGTHYESDYQHWDWAIDMNLGPIEYAATKYISRWWKKHGPIRGVLDVEKSKHYVEKIISAMTEGRYVSGFSRLPNGTDFSYFRTKKFGEANGMTPKEVELCWLLASWKKPESLQYALKQLDAIIQSPQTAAGGRGGVAGANGAGGG